MYKISLIAPTRERPQLFQQFIQSIDNTTHYKEYIEVLIICDDDDAFSQEYVNLAIKKYGQLHIRLLTRPRSEALNNDYYNFMASQATGDLIWVLADDLVLVFPNWDEDVQREAESIFFKYPDRILCFSMLDNTPPPSHRMPKFPCFPMFTKEARIALGGWILHPKILTWGADYVTYCTFQPIDRLVTMHQHNYLNHICSHNHQVVEDHINKRIGQIFNKNKMNPHHNTDRILAEEIPNIRLDLKQKIKDFTAGLNAAQEQSVATVPSNN